MSERPPEPPPEPPPDPTAEIGGLLDATKARMDRAGRRSGSRLYSSGIVVLIAALGYFAYTSKVADSMHLYLGLVIFTLAVIPGLLWAKRARFGLPLFEAFMIPGVNTYAIPLMSGHDAFARYDNGTITAAAVAVIVFQVTAITTYYRVKTHPRRGRVWRESILSKGGAKVLGYGMFITTVYSFVVQFTDLIPYAFAPEIRALCYGTGIIATFVTTRRWGQGELPHYERVIFGVQMVFQVICTWMSLFLVQGVSILLLGLIGYVSGSKKVPTLLLLICAPLIGILYNGKGTMRVKYWDQHESNPTRFTDAPAFFSEWVANGLDVSQQKEGAGKSVGVLDRTSLIQMLCLVVSISPDTKPYLMGETYAQIPGQFVPRILWPGKPSGLISTFTLSIYYNLQTAEEVSGTTIGFGMLPEAYANFGFLGLAFLGVALGLFFNKAAGWSAESPIFSYPGLFTIVLMAWTFQTEQPLSGWLASMSQACECVIGGPFILKNFL
jgi:hypothetical protein